MEPVISAAVKPGQIDKAEEWHNLRLNAMGKMLKFTGMTNRFLAFKDLLQD